MGKMKKVLNKSGKDGTALILSLLVLSIMVVASLAASHSSVTGKKTSLTSTKSGSAIQGADSASEKFISEFNNENSTDTLAVAGLTGCNSSSHRIKDGTNEVILYESDGTTEIPCDDSVKKVKDIAKIKSIGEDGGAKRAIEVTPPCGGVEFAAGSIESGDTGLVGYWPFSVSSQLNDITSINNDATKEKIGIASDLQVDSYQGKEALKLNNCPGCPNDNKHNYAFIDHKSEYEMVSGAISFWFYGEENNKKWAPFSKDAQCCTAISTTDGKYSAQTAYGAYPSKVDLNRNGLTDISEPDSLSYCFPNHFNDDTYDCGHFSYYIKPNDSIKQLKLRFQNDGNSEYALYSNKSDLGQSWHMATAIFSSSGYVLFIDGELQDKNNFNGIDTDGPEGLRFNRRPIFIGKNGGTLNGPDPINTNPSNETADKRNYFKGGIRELRIYNRTLESCEVKRLHEMTT